MGMLVNIKAAYNNTMADVEDVYIRVETLQIFPKYNAIRANITGFVSLESGYVMKQSEIEEVKAVENFFFTNNILNGATNFMSRDESVPPIQTGQEPQPIFREYYTIYMKDTEGNVKEDMRGVDITDYEAIYTLFYNQLKKYESRFENIRDVLIDSEAL